MYITCRAPYSSIGCTQVILQNCHHCDFEAWAVIFRPCAFQCTFFDRLRQLDLKEGLKVEILRARWTIAKMLNNWNRWKTASNVLHIQAKDFRANLTASLHKIAKFLRPNLKPTSSLGRMVSMAQAWGLDLQYAGRQCESDLCTPHLQFALNHASSWRDAPDRLRAQEALRAIPEWRTYIKPADDFFDKLIKGWAATMFKCFSQQRAEHTAHYSTRLDCLRKATSTKLALGANRPEKGLVWHGSAWFGNGNWKTSSRASS